MPVIEADKFFIGLFFDFAVDVTWNRFSSSIWDLLTGFGGSVSLVNFETHIFLKGIPTLNTNAIYL